MCLNPLIIYYSNAAEDWFIPEKKTFSQNKQRCMFVDNETLSSYDQTGQSGRHTPSIAFRHLPPNSARFSYATEGALGFISALRKVPVLIIMTGEAT